MNVKFEDDFQLEQEIENLDIAGLREVQTDKTETKDFVAVYNESKGQLVTVMPATNRVFSHRDVFLEIVSQLRAKNIKVKGVLKNNGSTAWVEMLFQDYKIKPKDGKEIVTGIRFVNSYGENGRPYFMAQDYALRLACANGMVGIVKETHIRENHRDLTKLRTKIADFVGRVLDTQSQIEELAEKSIADELELEPAAQILKAQIGSMKKVVEILRIFKEYSSNRWGLYNAITQFASQRAKSEQQFEFYQRVANEILKGSSAHLAKEHVDMEKIRV